MPKAVWLHDFTTSWHGRSEASDACSSLWVSHAIIVLLNAEHVKASLHHNIGLSFLVHIWCVMGGATWKVRVMLHVPWEVPVEKFVEQTHFVLNAKKCLRSIVLLRLRVRSWPWRPQQHNSHSDGGEYKNACVDWVHYKIPQAIKIKPESATTVVTCRTPELN